MRNERVRLYGGTDSLTRTLAMLELQSVLIPRPSDQPMEPNTQCRICLEEQRLDSMTAIHEAGLIQPCLCTGTSRWIHRTCLDTMRAAYRYSSGYTHCLICHAPYEFVASSHGHSLWRWLWFLAQMLVDVLVLLTVWHVCLLLVGACVVHFDRDGYLLGLMGVDPLRSHGWQRLAVYYVWSNVITFALVGLVTVIVLVIVTCAGRRPEGAAWGGADVDSATCFMLAVLVFATLGLIVGLVMAGHWFISRARRHVRTVWWMSEVRQRVVRDLSL